MVRRLKEHEIGERAETIQTTELLRWAIIPRGVLETCSYLGSIERPSANAFVKNSQGIQQ